MANARGIGRSELPSKCIRGHKETNRSNEAHRSTVLRQSVENADRVRRAGTALQHLARRVSRPRVNVAARNVCCDRHVLVLDNGNCFLYELYNSSVNSNGSWNADSTAVWDLLADEQRPYTWTSAAAAGLPIFPGLVRYDEVASGKIQHAFRFTLPHT